MLIHHLRRHLADSPLLADHLLLLLIDMPVPDIRTDRNGTAVGPVKLVLLLQRRKILPDSHLGNREPLRKIRYGNASLKLQYVQNRPVPVGKGFKFNVGFL